MSWELLQVIVLLLAAVVLFATGRVRMDVTALLLVVVFVLSGLLSLPEALVGFSDPNVILIAALFVVGEGLVRTGVAYSVGDWLLRAANQSETRMTTLLLLAVAGLGSVMSSTGVVAIFIPVALSIAHRMHIPPGRIMMPLSFAGLISGMMTLVATPPNLIASSELERDGLPGLEFFSVTPIGLLILAMSIAACGGAQPETTVEEQPVATEEGAFEEEAPAGIRPIIKSRECHFTFVIKRGRPVAEAEIVCAFDRRRIADEGDLLDSARPRDEDAALVAHSSQKRHFISLVDRSRIIMLGKSRITITRDLLPAACNQSELAAFDQKKTPSVRIGIGSDESCRTLVIGRWIADARKIGGHIRHFLAKFDQLSNAVGPFDEQGLIPDDRGIIDRIVRIQLGCALFNSRTESCHKSQFTIVVERWHVETMNRLGHIDSLLPFRNDLPAAIGPANEDRLSETAHLVRDRKHRQHCDIALVVDDRKPEIPELFRVDSL